MGLGRPPEAPRRERGPLAHAWGESPSAPKRAFESRIGLEALHLGRPANAVTMRGLRLCAGVPAARTVARTRTPNTARTRVMHTPYRTPTWHVRLRARGDRTLGRVSVSMLPAGDLRGGAVSLLPPHRGDEPVEGGTVLVLASGVCPERLTSGWKGGGTLPPRISIPAIRYGLAATRAAKGESACR
jgi:hypothetical protein